MATEHAPRELAWQAPEFEHRPKTMRWYWISIGIALLLLIFALWQADYIFAAFVVIGEIMLLVWGSSEPPMVSFSIGAKGLTIGGRTYYPFTDIKSWSADSEGDMDPSWPDVVLHFNGHFRPPMRIKAPRPLLGEVENALRAHAKEVPFEPTFMDVLEKLLGF